MAGRSLDKVEAAMSEIKKMGVKGSLSSLTIEVTDLTSIETAAKQVESEFGRVDVLINNAGVAPLGDDLKKQIEDTMAANVVGTALVSSVFNRLLEKSSRPYSLFISSGMGSMSRALHPDYQVPNDPWTVYRMSKAAVDMLMVQEYKVLSKKGIKVFAVCPGLVRSNLRGTEEHQVNAGGRAGDPDVSGRLILSIVEGKRDADVGKLVHKDGVWDW